MQKLNNLRNIRPDDAWKQNQRSLLLTQISNSAPKELSSWSNFVIVFKNSAKTFSQPAVAFASFVCFLFVSAVFSHNWLNSAKPTDSMYIARIISEKVKLNTVVDKDAREKLEVQFASEHAKDIAQVLADPKFNAPANEAEIAKLNNDFNKELETVKVRFNALSSEAGLALASSAPKTEEQIGAAASGKSDDGVQLYIPATAEKIGTTSTSTATSTKEKTIIDQAQDSFKKKDYQKTLDNLQKIEEFIK